MRIDWQSIAQRYASNGSDPLEAFVFCLPNAGRDLLLAVSHMLEWEATYRVSGYDFSDFADLQSVVTETEVGLMEGITLASLKELLEVDVNVTVNNDSGGGGCGCSSPVEVECITNVNQPIDYSAPEETIDREGEPPFDYPTFEEFDESACNAANFVASRPAVLLRQLDAYVAENVTTVTLVSLIGGVWGILAGTGTAAATGSGAVGLAIINILSLVNDGLGLAGSILPTFSEIAEEYESNLMPQIVCALYEARDSYPEVPSFAQDVTDWVTAEGYGSVAGGWIQDLLLNAFSPPLWLSLISGQIATPASNYVDCSTCNTADYSHDFGTTQGGVGAPVWLDNESLRLLHRDCSMNFAANSTVQTVLMASATGVWPNPIRRIEVDLTRFHVAGSETAERPMEVDFYRDGQSSPFFNAVLMTGAESLTLPLVANAAEACVSPKQTFAIDIPAPHDAEAPFAITFAVTGGSVGNAQIYMDAMRIFYN